MKSSVLAMRACSSSKVFSVSSCFGASTPARRATAPLAVSQQTWIWRANANMSGYRRAEVSTSGSILRASQCACALARIADRLFSIWAKRVALAWDIEMGMGCTFSFGPDLIFSQQEGLIHGQVRYCAALSPAGMGGRGKRLFPRRGPGLRIQRQLGQGRSGQDTPGRRQVGRLPELRKRPRAGRELRLPLDRERRGLARP